METKDLKHHYSQQFNAELEEIRSRVLAMGGLVESQLEGAIAALNRGDAEMAEAVVANDRKVNAYDVDIDERCTTILALRQPTASDLRLVLAVLKTTADIERIGDEVKPVARMVIRADGSGDDRTLFGQIVHLGEQVQQMLHSALDAFARMDVEAAIRVVREDVNIDQEYDGIVRQSTAYAMEHAGAVPYILDLVGAARSLERIGDRCRNIAEYVVYLVKGKDVRHTSVEKIEQALDE